MEENKTRVDLGTPIQKFYDEGLISARAFNICQYNDMVTLRDLAQCYAEGKLKLLRNCGGKTAKELEEIVNTFVVSGANVFDDRQEQQFDVSGLTKDLIKEYFLEGVISSEAYYCCERNNIITVNDLIRWQQNKGVQRLRYCRPKIIKEIESLIAIIDHTDNKLERYYSLPESIRIQIEKCYYTPRFDFSEECKEQFQAKFDQPGLFYVFFCVDQNTLAVRFNEIENMELKHYCYQLLTEVHNSLREEQLTVSSTYELIVIARAILWFCDEGFAKAIEADDINVKVRRRALQAGFVEKTSRLSARAKKIQQSYFLSYLDAIPYFLMSEKQLKDYLFPTQNMKITAAEMYRCIEEMRNLLFQHEDIDANELVNKTDRSKYPYLTEEQIGFVSEFYLQNAYYPMFFLLRQYLMKSDRRIDRLFAMSTGFCDGRSMTLEEIGKTLDYTRERIRQILKISSKNLFKDKDWNHYQLKKTLVLAKDDEIYTDVVNKEKLNISFELFARVCSMGFPLKRINVNGMLFLVNNRFDSQVISKVCKDAGKLKTKIKKEDVTFQVDMYLQNVASYKKQDYRQMLSIILTKAYGLAVAENGDVVFQKNTIDIENELCEILRSNGKRMSLTELFDELKRRCPEIKYDKPDQIRSLVLRSKNIKPIGKTSKYVLAEWDDVFLGSIRDLVAQILGEAKTPLHIDEIMGRVLLVYSDTNKRSVISSISNDPKRFVLLGDGYFGLVGMKYKMSRNSKSKPKEAATTQLEFTFDN